MQIFMTMMMSCLEMKLVIAAVFLMVLRRVA
jgi:hypothetical protein